MIVNLNIKQFRQSLSKLCKVASLTAIDSYASHLKLTAKNKNLYIEAINETKTQTVIIKFDEVNCSIQQEGCCCVPAKALQQTVELMIGDTIELSAENNVVNLKSLPFKKQDEIQSIEGLPAEQWLSMSKIESNNIIEIHRNFFLDVGRFTANSCSTDKSKAPLTAIHVNISKDGQVQCTATDYIKISLYDCEKGIMTDNIEDDISFMLPVDVAKKIPYIFEKDIDVISAKIDDKRIRLQGGNTVFGFSTEAGIDRYPPLRSYLLEDMDVYCEIDINELARIAGLLSAVASKSPCDITFESNQIYFNAQEKRNKSKQSLDIQLINNSNIELPSNIRIAIYDLVSSLSIPTSEKIQIGLVSIKNNAFGYLLELRQDVDNVIWRQIILKARDVIPEDDA